MERISWRELLQKENCHGRWVALDECSFDEATGKATDGWVVDMDDDLAELCSRMQEQQKKHCAIFFCKGDRQSVSRNSTSQ